MCKNLSALLIRTIKSKLGVSVTEKELDLRHNINYYLRDKYHFQTAIPRKLASLCHQDAQKIGSIIASSLQEKDVENIVSECNACSGFINVNLSDRYLVYAVIEIARSNFGYYVSQRKKLFLDFGGLNLCKNIHVGHLRSLFIGECIQRVQRSLGNRVISDVHYGDVGAPIGLVLAYVLDNQISLDKCDITQLTTYYSDAVASVQKGDTSTLEAGKKMMQQIQTKTADAKTIDMWQKILKLSKHHNKALFAELNINFDILQGESDSIDECHALVAQMNDNRHFKIDDGALVMLDENEVHIIQKRDGAYLYITTDIATAKIRMDTHNPDEIIYVVDERQRRHFKGVAHACEVLSICSSSCIKFLGFGVVTDNKGNILKTRDGKSLSYIQAVKLVENTMKKRYESTISKQEIISNLRFSILSRNRCSNYVFDLNSLSNRQGKTFSYIQYTLMRIRSLSKAHNADFKDLDYPQNHYERDILIHILMILKVKEEFMDCLETSLLVDHLYVLANLVNVLYERVNLRSLEDANKLRALSLYRLSYDCLLHMSSLLGVRVYTE